MQIFIFMFTTAQPVSDKGKLHHSHECSHHIETSQLKSKKHLKKEDIGPEWVKNGEKYQSFWGFV